MSKVADTTMQRSKEILRKLAKNNLRWTDLERATIHVCTSHSIFARTLKFLLKNRLIEKVGEKKERAPYRITEKGLKQLELWENV